MEKSIFVKNANQMAFESHIKSLFKRTNQNLNAFSRIASQHFEQRKLIINLFIKSQFSYVPVVKQN